MFRNSSYTHYHDYLILEKRYATKQQKIYYIYDCISTHFYPSLASTNSQYLAESLSTGECLSTKNHSFKHFGDQLFNDDMKHNIVIKSNANTFIGAINSPMSLCNLILEKLSKMSEEIIDSIFEHCARGKKFSFTFNLNSYFNFNVWEPNQKGKYPKYPLQKQSNKITVVFQKIENFRDLNIYYVLTSYVKPNYNEYVYEFQGDYDYKVYKTSQIGGPRYPSKRTNHFDLEKNTY